jgi:hypothetical protein
MMRAFLFLKGEFVSGMFPSLHKTASNVGLDPA